MFLSRNNRKWLPVLLGMGLCAWNYTSLAQTPSESDSPPGVGGNSKTTTSPAEIEAEKEQIWNSPEMLEARAYLETYFERSSQISDEQAKKYMADLKSLSPDQMRLWLLKFQQQRAERRQAYESERRARQLKIAGRQPAPNVGGFRNPYAGRRSVSTGLPAGQMHQYFGTRPNSLAQRPPIQKPFSSPQYSRARQPLVTSEEVARYEILRGLGPVFAF